MEDELSSGERDKTVNELMNGNNDNCDDEHLNNLFIILLDQEKGQVLFSGKSKGSTPAKHVRFPRAHFPENPYILSANNFLRAMC